MFPQSLNAFDEIGDPDDILKAENLFSFDYQDLQTKYNTLCETYAEEIENSNKIKKSLGKCLKLYSKLCKKYEAQKITIETLQKTINEKMSSLEESLKNQEKMRGLIDVYKRERNLFCAEYNFSLQKDKEILLDVCCKLISESVRTNSIRNIINLILKKFKNDLDKEKINLLREKQVLIKPKLEKVKNSDSNFSEPELKPDILANNFITKDIKNLDNENLGGNKNFKCDKLEKLELDGSEICKVEDKKTCAIPIENVSQNIKSSEGIKDPHTEHNLVFVEKKEEKNKLETNEKVESILPLSKNLIACPKKLDIEFVEKNRNFSPVEDGSKVILNDSNGMKLSSIKKNDEHIFETNKVNKIVENGLSILSFGQDNEERNNVEFSKQNKNIPNIEELSFERNYKVEKPFVDCTALEFDPEIAPRFLGENLTENSAVKLSKTIGKGDDNKKTSNSKLKDVTFISDSFSDALVDLGENNEQMESKETDSKDETLLYSNLWDVAPEEKNRSEKTVLQNSASLDNLSGITENKKSNCDIFVQNGSDGLNCENNRFVIEFFNSNDKRNLNSFSNGKSESVEDQSEQVDGKKLEVIHSELSQIFNEMSTFRLLSPIREINESHETLSLNRERNVKTYQKFTGAKSQSCNNQNSSLPQEKRKLTVCDPSECKKVKLNKKKTCEKQKKETANGLLDSIMEAMSTQNAQFKLNIISKPEILVSEQPVIPNCQFQNVENPQISGPQNLEFSSATDLAAESDKEVEEQKIQFTSKINQINANKLNLENLVTQKIQQFVSSSISSNEEAQKNVQDCLEALENTPATAIAKSIVGLVLANIDEKVEIFERPVPPLTRTQCRLITLLSVIKTKNSKFEKIVDVIMEEISSKLFPDNFFWPDDSVEMASRFYTALCKNRNDSENLWKFCLQAMTDMKQRSSVVVFTILKTWPDVLHEESTLKNNILATTIVNVILHTPLNSPPANGNRKKKLLGLKHLLMNFYGFKVNNTIEEFASTVLEAFFKNESVAKKSLVLLIRCRDLVWTTKHIFPRLGKALKELSQDDDLLGHRILGVFKQIVPVFSENKGNFQGETQAFISYLSDALSFGKLSHESEQKVIEVLMCLKHFPEVKKKIREWIPKDVVREDLRNEIINLSSENILRELKFNRRRDLLESQNKSNKNNNSNSSSNSNNRKKLKFGNKFKKKKKRKNCQANKQLNKKKLRNCKPQLNLPQDFS